MPDEGKSPEYGFTNTYEPTPQAKALGKVIDILNDPRNSWIGLGPLSAAMGMVKGPGWGAEALRRYKLIGGTPETLDKTLKMRPIPQESRSEIVKNFKAGTDIATPSGLPHDAPWEAMGGLDMQRRAFDLAGMEYESLTRGGRPNTRGGFGPLQHVTMHRPDEPSMQSAAAGNAAYGAVSRQVGRMLDTPGFQFSKPQDLPVVPMGTYLKEFPIKGENPFWRQDSIARGQAEARRAPTPADRRANVNQPSGQRGGTTSGGERYNYETQRWEPDDRR